MVDFSKLQKISNLARELMKHGQANSMDEAMKMASQQVESGNVPEYVDAGGDAPAPAPVDQPQAAEHIEPVQENVELPQLEEGQDSHEMVHKLQEVINTQQATLAKLSTVINVHTNQMNDLSGMSNKFNQLVAEIAEIKTDLKKLKESPVMPAPNNKGQTSFKPSTPQPPEGGRAEEAKTEQAPPAPGQSSGHVRSGNYKSDDVSIEKMFYYGGK